MRHGKAMGASVLLALLSGCAAPEVGRPSSWLASFRAAQGLLGPDVVRLEFALLERPFADDFLNKELWNFTDEQLVDLERKPALDKNGFRVGLIVGMPPEAFQNFLTSERSCVNPNGRIVPSGKVVPQVLGPAAAQCRFNVQQNGAPVTITLDNAEFVLDVVPFLTDDGRTRLRFTPKVQYGEVTREIRPAPDRSGFTMQMEKPHKTFADLNWEVTLAPNEFLIVGGRLDRPDSLGYHAFIQEDASPAVQRLLVIRTARAAPAPEDTEGSAAEDRARSNPSPPLAVQATLSARTNRQ